MATLTKKKPSSITDDGGIKVMKGDRRFASLCRGFNPRWTSSPEYVRLVRTGEEACRALEKAVREKPEVAKRDRITVRAGGHCYENFVCADDVRVIIDVSLLDGIYTEKQKGPKGEDIVCIEAGATNGDLRKRLFLATGKALPGGSCSTVGMGGHIPAGGFGLLSRQYGLTVDYLYGVEVAVVDSKKNVKLVKATRDSKDPKLRELWWAHTGGGGGNFGIVTKFWFHNLPTAPEHVLFSSGGWPWKDVIKSKADFTRIVNNFGKFFAEHRGRDKFSALFGILLLTHAGNDQIGLLAQMDASIPNAKDRMNTFLRAMDRGHKPKFMPLEEAIGHYPALPSLGSPMTPAKLTWNTVDKTLDPVDNLKCGKYKSAYLRKPMGPEQIDAMWKSLAGEGRSVTRDAVVQVDSYGSAINRKSKSATAAYQRDSIMKLQHQIYWPAPGKGTDELAWIRTLYYNMFKSTGGVPVPDVTGKGLTDGCYIGYPDVDLSSRWNASEYSWHDLYYGTGRHYQRMQQVKENFDPLGIFRHQQSVQPFMRPEVRLPRPRQPEGAVRGTRAAARPARAGGGRATATAATRRAGARGATKPAGGTRTRAAAARGGAAKAPGTARTQAARGGAAKTTRAPRGAAASKVGRATTPAKGGRTRAAATRATRAPAAAKGTGTRAAAAKNGRTRATAQVGRTRAAAAPAARQGKPAPAGRAKAAAPPSRQGKAAPAGRTRAAAPAGRQRAAAPAAGNRAAAAKKK
ncbi:FAD-binding protein [Nocardiopsis sediminis]|uniref:FAD-binding protein n=1 Tax=Nocardiopsis sediminis TaxID=1778267 RepID=A0ABV8FPT5_9ACTN